MFKPSQHPTFNMVYNMLYNMLERFAPAFKAIALFNQIAQWLEIVHGKNEVMGSNLTRDNFCMESKNVFLFTKTSARRLQDMSWTRLKDVFSKTISRFLRCLQYMLQRRLQDIFKTSSRRHGRQIIVTLKASSRRLQDMSSRRAQDIYWNCLQDVSKTFVLKISWRQVFTRKESTTSASNKPKSIPSKSISDESLIRTQ